MGKCFLVTGGSGFVARHFFDYLETLSEDISVVAVDVCKSGQEFPEYHNITIKIVILDLLDRHGLESILQDSPPDYLLHLASYSSVAYSWEHPDISFANNTNIFLNLLEQVRLFAPECRILSVGSSEEYGKVRPDQVPLLEDAVLHPVSPYAVARVSQELMTRVYVEGYGMDIVLTRSFNHAGPGQKDIFVISSFSRKLAEALIAGKSTIKLFTGNTTIVRDFVDVRDVVRAYHLLLTKGSKGEVYNVCSGIGRTIDEVLMMMSRITGISVQTIMDSKLVRPSDNPIIIGSCTKLMRQTGWQPGIPLERTLQDTLNYWHKQLLNS